MGGRIAKRWTLARWVVAMAVVILVAWGFVRIVQPADPRITPAADTAVPEEPIQMEPLGPPMAEVDDPAAAAPAADTAGADTTAGGEGSER